MSNAKVTLNPMQATDAAATRTREAEFREHYAPARETVKRCGARTRGGYPCPTAGMPNGRCRMHGGTSPGAPLGNQNGWKHGGRSAEHQAMRRVLRMLREDLRQL